MIGLLSLITAQAQNDHGNGESQTTTSAESVSNECRGSCAGLLTSYTAYSAAVPQDSFYSAAMPQDASLIYSATEPQVANDSYSATAAGQLSILCLQRINEAEDWHRIGGFAFCLQQQHEAFV